MEKIVDFIVKYRILLISIVAVMLFAMIGSLAFLVYNSTLHIDTEQVSGVYGMNGVRNTKIIFDDETVEAVLNSVKDMKYDGTDKGVSGSYQTYVCIEMTNGKQYHIKYCDSTGVYISKGAARIGRYTCTDDILKITYALERKNGANADSQSK